MKWEEVAQLPYETVLALYKDCLQNLLRVDAYWFLGMEKMLGTAKAIEVDKEVWSRLGRHEALQIKKNFGLTGDGIGTLVRALRLAPTWTLWGNYRVEQTSDTQAVLQVIGCFSQQERLRMGLGVFDCQGVEEGYFISFASSIDPKIKVRCEFCPPHKYFENLWCEWHFELESGGKP